MNRQNKIINYIKNKTLDIINHEQLDSNGVEATQISFDLKLDRANVSRVLNVLWKQGELIKKAGRPVFYYDYQTVSNKYPDIYFPSFIEIGSSFTLYIKDSKTNNIDVKDEYKNLSNTIGANGSLSKEIQKAKAAVVYPPYGLHTIIHGNDGIKKTDFANSMINYAINLDTKNKHCPYFEVDCKNYGEINSFDEKLFGVVNKSDKQQSTKGILQKCSNGFVVLEHIEALSEQSINLLSSALNKNYYNKINSNDNLPLETMIIMTTNASLDEEKISKLAKYVPVQIKLEDVDSRGIYEKLELILQEFSEEAKRTRLSLKISKDVLSILVGKRYPGNITQMSNEIKLICSKAYLDTRNKEIETVNVSLLSLPQELLELRDSDFYNESKLNISMLLNVFKNDYIFFDGEGNSNEYNYFLQFPQESAKHLLSQFANEFSIDTESIISLDDYANESISCLTNCSKVQLSALKSVIDSEVYHIVTMELFKHQEYKNLENRQELLYGVLLHITNSVKRITNNHISSIEKPSISNNIYTKEYEISKNIFNKLEDTFNFKAINSEIDYLTSYLTVVNNYLNRADVAILVIAHGNCVASDMVAYINKYVDKKIYIDSIDYNDGMRIDDLLELACHKAINLNQGSGVIVMADMEPLLTVHEAIIRTTGISSKTVFPLSLTSLLDIINNNISSINDLDTLKISNSNKQNYSIIKNDRNEFILNLTERIIKNTTSFIDCYKAIEVLNVCLNKTLENLDITYSNDIAVKYFCHCVNMLERVIKNETWENNRLNKFISNNSKLMQIVSKELEYANNSFGIKIPQSELIYVTEIFIPYTN